jgi:hypothetical protein
MRSVRLHVLAAIVIVMATAGCTGDGKDGAPRAGGVGPTTGIATPAVSASTAPGMDEETKAACENLDAEIKKARKAVAKAERIGPPAGHHAVSAAWSAAAASIAANGIGANDAVSKAVDDVTQAMSEIADKYVKATSRPDKSAVNRAIDQLTKACSAS